MTSSAAMITTYFAGTHYEVANGVVTKYYYAGSQRIAMRKNGTLSFTFGDHPSTTIRTSLGSTSLTTFANGNVVFEMRDKSCLAGMLREGKVRL